MAINLNDVKRLWGTSGGRCSICRIELSAIESTSVLGEMCHIISKSPNGPRGKSQIDKENIDCYDNLILLCPTHHKVIDSTEEEWDIAKLIKLKNDHEKWVNSELENGRIIPTIINFNEYIDNRINYWWNKNNKYWLVVSLTPLQIIDDVIDPVNEKYIRLINDILLPEYIHRCVAPRINQYFTEPSTNGLINEDFRGINAGAGYRIEIFRNGYIEYSICYERLFGYNDKKADQIDFDNKNRLISCENYLSYYFLLNTISTQIKAIFNIFKSNLLPFKDMILTSTILTPIKLSIKIPSPIGIEISRPLENNINKYSFVINSNNELLGNSKINVKKNN